MRIRYWAPPADLREYVQCFWTLDFAGASGVPATLYLVADGRPGLFFYPFGRAALGESLNKTLPQLFVYGQTTAAQQISLSGPGHVLGAYLHPGALPSIFGWHADSLTGSCLDLHLLAGPSERGLLDQLHGPAPVASQLGLLAAFLRANIAAHAAAPDTLVQTALQRIQQAGGNVALGDLQAELQLSERTLQRRFKQRVGITPQLFARICRFQQSLTQLQQQDYAKLSDLAYGNDYADQSHHIRAFREFAGVAPHHYRQQAAAPEQRFLGLRT